MVTRKLNQVQIHELSQEFNVSPFRVAGIVAFIEAGRQDTLFKENQELVQAARELIELGA